MNREALIEEAAKAVLDAAETPENIRDEQVWEWARRDARAALAVFEQAHTLRSATEKDRADLERLRETLAGSSPSEVRGEAVVNHRIGFWNISDPYDPEITAEMIALADEELERYVQQRIGEAYTSTDDERAEVERVQKAAWAEIHGQDPTRKYSVAEVKRIVYSFDNVLSGLLARRPVQGEPTDAQEAEIAAKALDCVATEFAKTEGLGLTSDALWWWAWFAEMLGDKASILRAEAAALRAAAAVQGGENRG